MKMQTIERKIELENNLKKHQQQLLQFDRLHDLKMELERRETELRLFEERAENPLFAAGMMDLNGQRAELQRAVKMAEQDYQSAIDEKGKLEASMQQIRDELDGLTIFVSVADLAKMQKRKEALSAEIGRVEKIIEKEACAIDVFVADDNYPLTVLTRRKEVMLADRALGIEIDEKELDSIQEQIISEESAHAERLNRAAEINHLINGLRARKTALETELMSITACHREALNAFLSQELMKAGEEYYQRADSFFQTFCKIATIDKFLRDSGASMGSAVLPFSVSRFSIPALNLGNGVDKQYAMAGIGPADLEKLHHEYPEIGLPESHQALQA